MVLHGPHRTQELVAKVASQKAVVNPMNNSPPLSKREREVLHRLLAEKFPKAIAAELGISASTVKTHLQRIQFKSGAKTIIGLVKWCAANGLLPVVHRRHKRDDMRPRRRPCKLVA